MSAVPNPYQKSGLQRVIDTISNRESVLGYLFILPSLIGFVVFFAVPAVRSVFISFTKWNSAKRRDVCGSGELPDDFRR